MGQYQDQLGGSALDLIIDLLREHVAAERNASIEGHGGKIGTLAALRICPRNQCWNHPRDGGPNEIEQPEVRGNGAKITPVLRPVRAKLHKLQDPGEVITGSSLRNPGYFSYLFRQRLLHGGGNQGSAIGHEELQQQDCRNDKDKGCH